MSEKALGLLAEVGLCLRGLERVSSFQVKYSVVESSLSVWGELPFLLDLDLDLLPFLPFFPFKAGILNGEVSLSSKFFI